jgi:lambda family phage portal protein
MADGDVVSYLPAAGRTAASLYPGLEEWTANNAFLFPSLLSAHEENQIGRREATRQARQAERRSESIRGGIDRKAHTVIGADLFPQITPDWRTLGITPQQSIDYARQAEALFKSWAIDRRKLADAEGHYTFGGLMWMAFRNLTGPDGETFGIIHYDTRRARRLNSPWNTCVTVLDPQRVETPPEHMERTEVVDGKLVDEYGRMLGYYFNRQPRGPQGLNVLEHGFCPRENNVGRPMGWHHFAKHRGAAQRGITALANILKRSTNLDKLDGAQLGAAIVAAAMATFVKTKGTPEEALDALAPAGTTGGNDMLAKWGFYDKLKLRIGPQRIPVLPDGDEITITAADRSAGDPTKFRSGYLRDFASAIGSITGEALSLDYSDVNYSSARAALIDIWRGVVVERSMFNNAVAALCVDAVLEECIVKGWLTLPPGAPGFYEEREAWTRCTFTGPAMGWVDPKKEAEAAQLRVDPARPLSTLTQETASQGRSFEDVAEERAREQDTLLSLGLITDIAAPPPGAPPPSEDPPEPPEQREEPQ